MDFRTLVGSGMDRGVPDVVADLARSSARSFPGIPECPRIEKICTEATSESKSIAVLVSRTEGLFEDVAVRECTDAKESVRMQIDLPTGLVERRKEHDSLMAMSSAWKTELL